MDRRTFLATVGGTAVALAGCLSADATAEYDIGMSTNRFLPDAFAVAPGTTVVWKNTSSHAHTVTAYEDRIPEDAAYFASGGYDSEGAARDAWDNSRGGAIDGGRTYEYTFEQPGTYHYVCIPHERNGMVGTIRVTESATRTPK